MAFVPMNVNNFSSQYPPIYTTDVLWTLQKILFLYIRYVCLVSNHISDYIPYSTLLYVSYLHELSHSFTIAFYLELKNFWNSDFTRNYYYLWLRNKYYSDRLLITNVAICLHFSIFLWHATFKVHKFSRRYGKDIESSQQQSESHSEIYNKK